MPDLVDGKTRDFDRPLLTKDRQRFDIGWTGRGRRLDDSQGAVAEIATAASSASIFASPVTARA
jgi:hypothetical protein